MKKQNLFTKQTTLAALWLALSASLGGAPLIYEPFDDSETPLNGNVPGFGLSGTWTGNHPVTAGSLSYGSLPTSGNQVAMSVRTNSRIDSGSTLGDAGLLANGATLWFSALFKTGPGFGANPDQGFAFGTNTIGNSNNLPMGDAGDGGQGVGFTIKNGQARASYWNASEGTSVKRSTGQGLTTETTYLIVGEIIWGADGDAEDTINLYLPNTDLEQGEITSTDTGVLDQSKFDTISFGNKADSLPTGIDEIRFGASYEDVTGGDGPDAPPFAITAIDYDRGTDMVTLTWRKTVANLYTAKFSKDMSNWDFDMGDSFTAADDENTDDDDNITVTFDLGPNGAGVPMEDALFFRIEENLPQ